MTNTLLTPTDGRTKVDPFDLDEIATELRCLSSNIYLVSCFVEPREMQEINTQTEKTMQEAFFSIMRNIDGIADRLEDASMRLMQEQKTTATPTDESKDCR